MRPINQTPQSADGAYERETIINFCDAEKTCSYYTRNYSRMNELRWGASALREWIQPCP